MVNNILEGGHKFYTPFDYDEVFFNTLTRSYEFMKDGVLVAEYLPEDIKQ